MDFKGLVPFNLEKVYIKEWVEAKAKEEPPNVIDKISRVFGYVKFFLIGSNYPDPKDAGTFIYVIKPTGLNCPVPNDEGPITYVSLHDGSVVVVDYCSRIDA